ncbi:type I-E CRISPR-associated protein Cse2/CasB [bacterium]|nr:type I-E CRISPR-associated protein Cse2/CasB [bacterium]
MRFFEQLERNKDNRGMMANLRCILIPNKKQRAWPVLHRLGIAIDNESAAFVAGLYAKHPEITNKGNFGNTCKQIELRRDVSKEKEKITPTERRFQHLLSANKEEVQDRVLRMVMMAERENIPVNYEKLVKDLTCWKDKIKTEWAAAYWAPFAEKLGEEE